MTFFPKELLKRGFLLGSSPLEDHKSPFFSSSREKAAKLPLTEMAYPDFSSLFFLMRNSSFAVAG